MKKLLATILTVVLVISLLPATAVAAVAAGGDLVVDGGVTEERDGDVSLISLTITGESKLTVHGNLTITGGDLTVANGTLVVDGDLRVLASPTDATVGGNFDNAKIIDGNNLHGSVSVGGDMHVDRAIYNGAAFDTALTGVGTATLTVGGALTAGVSIANGTVGSTGTIHAGSVTANDILNGAYNGHGTIKTSGDLTVAGGLNNGPQGTGVITVGGTLTAGSIDNGTSDDGAAPKGSGTINVRGDLQVADYMTNGQGFRPNDPKILSPGSGTGDLTVGGAMRVGGSLYNGVGFEGNNYSFLTGTGVGRMTVSGALTVADDLYNGWDRIGNNPNAVVRGSLVVGGAFAVEASRITNGVSAAADGNEIAKGAISLLSAAWPVAPTSTPTSKTGLVLAHGGTAPGLYRNEGTSPEQTLAALLAAHRGDAQAGLWSAEDSRYYPDASLAPNGTYCKVVALTSDIGLPLYLVTDVPVTVPTGGEWITVWPPDTKANPHTGR